MDYIVHGILWARILEWVASPSPEDLPDPGIELGSPALQVDPLPTELSVQFSSLTQSCQTFCDPHESQHARPPCPSPTPRVHSDVHRVSDAIQPSHPLSSPSPPAPSPSQHQGLFQ